MLMSINIGNRELFERSCAFERVMGSKCRNSLDCYGEEHPSARFLLGQRITGEPTAALYQNGDVLTISADDRTDPLEIAEYIMHNGVKETDTNLRLAQLLQSFLGGKIESSFYMVYDKPEPPGGDFSAIAPCETEDAFMVLQQSHEYYRTHLRYNTWAADIKLRMRNGFLELYKIEEDGEPIATGSIVSQDDECGVVAAVAVIPECRHRGIGALMSSFLTARIMELGKTPRLISGYDGVAELYRSIGYTDIGRWGELYL